jgi:hypothetical protein
MTSKTVNIESALNNPGAAFATPEEVLAHTGLTTDQKIEILKRWEYDAAESEVATEEGMPGDGKGLLRRILLALHELTGHVDVSRTGPTKQDPLL